MGEMKKAMPFVQSLKRRLDKGETLETVLERKLAFEEGHVLREMSKGLKRTTGCVIVEIVEVSEGGKTGTVVGGEGHGKEGEKKEPLPSAAEQAVPGSPAFHFENIKD